ncbi:MBL fold metallo-hydrolase [Zoogloea sp.]|uniref:MBL fold metallo-hydrolase n=1 Tax=Zoogloea sp. TaxID=49181 RepID=UPI002635C222|nr:MBL fold metallo-hydrolase [Zoogloea sp.]MDD3355150.1 MBL fold metallo-hydrolase [Zoogloea sp.]
MHLSLRPWLGLTTTLSLLAVGSASAQTLESAIRNLGSADTRSVQIAGSGNTFQFGQAPDPSLPWPRFELKRYTADIDYERAAARVQIQRIQAVEAGRLRPVPVEQRVDQYVAGPLAWNLPTASASAGGGAPAAVPQSAAARERAAEIWATPQGFLRAAAAHKARSKALKGGGREIRFKLDGRYRFVGHINSRHEVERVRTWIDNPVLGDTLVETRFSKYQTFEGRPFPTRIERIQGGHPVLDLQVSEVRFNAGAAISVPSEIANAVRAPLLVKADPLADGVFYLTGGSHHSVLIEQKDHLVIVEAPLDEERSLAVIAKAREIAPGKPIRYLVNTHAHFDHSGGLRTFVAEGATIVTPQANIPYYRQAWSAPRTLKPDLLAGKGRKPAFIGIDGKQVLSDGQRSIEVHSIVGSGHSDAFALVYLPAEKILVEGDAYTPTAASVPPPARPNPFSVNLHDNILRLGLNVERIAALHGPRVVTLADLRTAIGEPASAP